MKIAIMQPYLFPYIGYFQLINAVDLFVVYDDVQYINRGWINRNQILNNGKPHLFTMSLKKGPSLQNINQREFFEDWENQKQKLIKTLTFIYSKAPYFNPTINLIQNIFENSNRNISSFITYQISQICEYIGIPIILTMSSDLKRNSNLKGEEAIIDIIKIVKGNHYINPTGGRNLYSKTNFANNNIQLNFLQNQSQSYVQFGNKFVPNLSIIDVLMFNSKQKIKEMLHEYVLI